MVNDFIPGHRVSNGAVVTGSPSDDLPIQVRRLLEYLDGQVVYYKQVRICGAPYFHFIRFYVVCLLRKVVG